MATVFIRGAAFLVSPPAAPLPALLPNYPWPRDRVHVGLFFHGGDGPLRIDGEPLNDEPFSAGVAALASRMGLLWMPVVTQSAMLALMGDLLCAWREHWWPEEPPELVLEHTHRGHMGPTPRRRRNQTRVVTQAEWNRMSKPERRRLLRRKRLGIAR